MKALLVIACTSGLLLAGLPAMAQTSNRDSRSQDSRQSSEVGKQQTTETNNGTVKTKGNMYYGKVEAYEPGKTLKVSVPGKAENTKSFDLSDQSQTVDVASNVKVGDWVRVDQKKDNNGHTTVTVKESKKHQSS